MENLARFELAKGIGVTLENVNEALTAIRHYLQNAPVNEWQDYKIHQHHLKKAMPIQMISDLYHVNFYNCVEDTIIKDICLVYDSYSGVLGIWSEKFGQCQNETYLEIELEIEDEAHFQTTFEMYVKMINEL